VDDRRVRTVLAALVLVLAVGCVGGGAAISNVRALHGALNGCSEDAVDIRRIGGSYVARCNGVATTYRCDGYGGNCQATSAAHSR
jgi:hypothetical protein